MQGAIHAQQAYQKQMDKALAHAHKTNLEGIKRELTADEQLCLRHGTCVRPAASTRSTRSPHNVVTPHCTGGCICCDLHT